MCLLPRLGPIGPTVLWTQCEIDTQSLEGTLFVRRLLASSAPSAFRSPPKLQPSGGGRHSKFGVPREFGPHHEIFDLGGGSKPSARIEHDLCLEQCEHRDYEKVVIVTSSCASDFKYG